MEDISKEKSGSSLTSETRRNVLKGLGSASAGVALAGCAGESTNDEENGETDVASADEGGEFRLIEASIEDIHAAMDQHELSAVDLVEEYLDRIEEYDDELKAFLHINEDAVSRAESLDEELEESGPTGPLHGIPVVLKDNNDTSDMPTTSGSKTLEGVVPAEDAEIVARLRDAGAIVLGKTNMHEFAAGIETYSSLGGQTMSPYGYAPGGSSGGSGAAVAANLATISTATDTCGSIRIPAANNNSVGIRGTIGLISRDGIAPMSVLQDIGGPLTRTVADTAIMCDVLVGYDPADPSTARSIGNVPVDPEQEVPITTSIGDVSGDEEGSYTDFLNEDGLEGARIGVIRDYIDDESDEGKPVAEVVEAALSEFEDAGAEIVDPVSPPPANNGVIGTEFHREFNNYLSSIGDPDAPQDLSEIAAESDDIHPEVAGFIEGVAETDISTLDEDVDYLQDIIARDDFLVLNDEEIEPGNRQQVLVTMAEEELDALLYPTISEQPVEIPEDEPADQNGSNCNLSAGTGLPAITVPGGFTDDSRPIGIELLGRRWSEGRLIELAYAYEQHTQHRTAPEEFGELD